MRSRSGRRSQRTWFGLPGCKEAKLYQRGRSITTLFRGRTRGACPRLLDAQGDWRPEGGPDDEAAIRRWFAPRVHPEAPGSEREQAFATEALAEADYVLQIRWVTVKHLHVNGGGATRPPGRPGPGAPAVQSSAPERPVRTAPKMSLLGRIGVQSRCSLSPRFRSKNQSKMD